MMNQEDIFKKIGLILNELQDQYEFLAQNPKQLNELELELFLANANFLSDHVQIVRKINNNKPLKALPEHTETPADSIEVVAAKLPEMTKERTLDELKDEYSFVQEEEPVSAPAVPVFVVEEPKVAEPQLPVPEEPVKEEAPIAIEQVQPEKPAFRDELFKFDSEASKFDFILNDDVSTDKFEFEEKPIDAIFDRPLSKEEAEIIAEKQRLRDSQLQAEAKVEAKEEVKPVIVPEQATPEQFAPEVKPEPILAFVPDKVEEKLVSPASVEPVLDKVDEKIVHKVEEKIVEKEEEKIVEKEEEKVVQKPEVSAFRPTLNDLLAGKNNTAGSSNNDNNKTVITDLKQAINLNQKLLYIKDLFNGYNLAYAEAIELLNKMPDFKTADAFLQNNYALKNNWTSKQSTVDQFYELLNQRFPIK